MSDPIRWIFWRPGRPLRGSPTTSPARRMPRRRPRCSRSVMAGEHASVAPDLVCRDGPLHKLDNFFAGGRFTGATH